MSRFGWPNLLPAASSCVVRHALRVALAIVILLGVAGPWSVARASPPRQAGGPGEALFQAKCVACHTIGKGKLVGPDLKDVTARRDPQWLKAFIADPNKLFATDPTAQQLLVENNNVKMPALGLTDAEIAALVTFLGAGPAASPPAGQAQGQASQQPAPAAPALVEDPAAGFRTFTGQAAQANGGPACIGCHSVAGLGGLGGGALGPDLTHAAQRYPGVALASVLGNIAFPTMIGPFTNRPLTPQEQANLVAYLDQVDQGQMVAPPVTPGALTPNTGLLLAVGLGGVFALTVLLAVFWPRQRQSVSARLRNKYKPAIR